jgi:hypothetical protein
VFFDVDHKIPQCCGGPDDAWNLWPLCLRDHRQKCIAEIEWVRNLRGSERRCFSCNAVTSSYFRTHALWCPECLKLTQEERSKNLTATVKTLF